MQVTLYTHTLVLRRCIFCADGDGKKNEGKNKKKPSFADKDSNGKVDAFEKKK